MKSARKLVKHCISTTVYIIPFSENYINAIKYNPLTDASSIQLKMFIADYHAVSQKIGMTKFFYYLQILI